MVKENKKFLIIFSLLILGGLFLEVQPAYAFLDIPYNISTMQLDSLDFVENSILRFLVLLVLLVAESATFLVISAGLLDWASSLPSGLNQQLVTTGWGFTNSLASMFFILIFVAIAFSYIFKTETWGMQKALPKLIIIALLINFSLLFVQMTADIGWVAQNSFKSALFGTGPLKLASEAMGPLRDSMGSVIKLAASIPIGYLTLAAIPAPWLSVGGLLVTGTMALGGEALFGMISQPIILIIFNFTAGLIFLAYAILFLVRIGVIWLLAITAPLAFLAFIMPQTEKYFKQWLQALFNWTFFGVVVFFVMGLGLKLFGFFATGETLTFAGLGAWNFPIVYYKYIFLFIYLIVALMFAKKFMPAGTEMVWSLGGMVRDRGVKLAAEQTRKYGLRAQAAGLEAAAGTKQQIMDKRARGAALSWRERIASPFLRQVRPELAEAQALALRGEIIKDQRSKLLAKTKDTDEEGAKAVLRAEMEKHKRSPIRDKNKTAALIELLADKNALNEDDLDSGMYLEAWKAAGPEDMKQNAVKKAALARNLHWGTYNERKSRIEKMTSADIEKFSISAKENDTVIKEIVGTLNSAFISRLGSQTKTSMIKVQKEIDNTIGETWRNLKTGMKDLSAFITHINTLNADQRKKILQQFEVMRYIHHSPSTQGTGWKKYGSIQKGAPDNIEDRIEEIRKTLRP